MSSSSTIRILCIDDHPIVLEGLMGVMGLQPDFTVVGTATSGKEAVKLFDALRPEIVLLDVKLRDMTGFEVMQQILKIQADARIVMLTSLEGDADIERALAMGARGYVVKGATRDELARAIRSVHAGRRYIPSEVAAKMAEHLSSEKLTSREHAVLTLMAQGKRNKEIGADLTIAEDTVKMHVKNILAKLGVNDRTEAVTTAIRRGILHL
jgi:DNA-binding NarL/FixJ family response regulator